jgi:hypothetical protein
MKKGEIAQLLNKTLKVMKNGEVKPRGRGGSSAKDFFVGKDSKPTELAKKYPECARPKKCDDLNKRAQRAMAMREPGYTYYLDKYTDCVEKEREEQFCPPSGYVDKGKQAGIVKPVMQITDSLFYPSALFVEKAFPIACSMVGGPVGSAACKTLEKKFNLDEYNRIFLEQADFLPGEEILLNTMAKKGLIDYKKEDGKIYIDQKEDSEELKKIYEEDWLSGKLHEEWMKEQGKKFDKKKLKKPEESKSQEPVAEPKPETKPQPPQEAKDDLNIPPGLTPEEEQLFREIMGGQLGRSVLGKIQKLPLPVPKKRGRKKLAEKNNLLK